MSIEINVVDCTSIVIERHGDAFRGWETYTFINGQGEKVEVNAFHKKEPVTLRSIRERFEKSSATGA